MFKKGFEKISAKMWPALDKVVDKSLRDNMAKSIRIGRKKAPTHGIGVSARSSDNKSWATRTLKSKGSAGIAQSGKMPTESNPYATVESRVVKSRKG